jgi:hypothetical protein
MLNTPDQDTKPISTKPDQESEIDRLQIDQLTDDEVEDLISLDPTVFALTARLTRLRAGKQVPGDTEEVLVNKIKEARKLARDRLFPEKAAAELAKENQRKTLVAELVRKIKPGADFDSKLRSLGFESYGIRSLPLEILSDKTRNALVEYFDSIKAFDIAFKQSAEQNRDVEAMKTLDIIRSKKHKAASESLSSDIDGVLTVEECNKVIEEYLGYRVDNALKYKPYNASASQINSIVNKVLDKLIEEYSPRDT